MINPHFTRRRFISFAAGASAAGLGLALSPGLSLAANPTGERLHGLSSFGNLKYTEGFPHFEYASPDAPQGGTFSFGPSYWYFNQNVQTFNTLNSFVLKGDSPPRMEYCFDTLMVWAIDEPDALYCSAAEWVEISEDRNRYIFKIRDNVTFHDGSKLTADDAAFSYMLMKEQGHPQISLDLRNLDSAVAQAGNELVLTFNGKQSDRAILSVANIVPLFSRAFFEGKEFDSSRLEPILASGPWKVGKFKAGQFVEYERNRNYWAKDLAFAKGLDHFDKLRIDFFAERTAAFEAFKKGDIFWREEFTSKVWAKEYNFPAVQSGQVIKHTMPDELRPSMQGWAINTRRPKFADIRTRQAIGLCFDFQWTNKNLFFDAYKRSQSLFETSDFKAEGEPSAQELALLEPYRGKLPTEVFGEAIQQPKSDGSGSDRNNLRTAFGLMREAGWVRKNGKLVDSRGEQLTLEFLIRSPTFERVLGGFVGNLKQLGIAASIRLVDPSQFQARLDKFDFDLVGTAFSFGPSPTAESMRQFFSSAAADQSGSYNHPGIRLEVVDSLLEKLGQATSRSELIVAMRVIDRVLRAYSYWIPNWYSPHHRIANWDMFGWKEPKPDYHFPVERLWWHDSQKAKRIGKG